MYLYMSKYMYICVGKAHVHVQERHMYLCSCTSLSSMSVHVRTCYFHFSGCILEAANAGAFIQALLDLQDTYNQFLQESFAGDQVFRHAITSVREEFRHNNAHIHVNMTCRWICTTVTVYTHHLF